MHFGSLSQLFLAQLVTVKLVVSIIDLIYDITLYITLQLYIFTFIFRNQLMWFNIYLAFLSYLQFTYQRGCLYRLKSLGLRNNEMDITIDGFHSWMWKGIYNFKF